MNSRTESLLFLVALLVFLTIAGIFAKAANERDILQQEHARLQEEILTLEAENAQLRERIAELKEQQAEIGDRMEKWLDTWEVQEVEISGYAPLDARAISGWDYSGNPRVTSSGVETAPG